MKFIKKAAAANNKDAVVMEAVNSLSLATKAKEQAVMYVMVLFNKGSYVGGR